ncbi:MAG: hypothetical protein B7733_23620 [Myxococcales bacterium FL481]|nr:MAG: hypothetical protein B7733_23620 [Myxococcales bacterium FL481]
MSRSSLVADTTLPHTRDQMPGRLTPPRLDAAQAASRRAPPAPSSCLDRPRPRRESAPLAVAASALGWLLTTPLLGCGSGRQSPSEPPPPAPTQARQIEPAAASNRATDPRRPTATDLTRLKLVQFDSDGRPGFDTLAVTFDIEPGWHIYWINPGDSGLTTRVEVTGPPTLRVEDTRYPAPNQFVGAGDILGYGYGAPTALFVGCASEDASLHEAEVTVEAQWLVCQQSCLRGRQTLTTRLTRNPTAPSAALRDLWSRVPRPATELPAKLTWRTSSDAATLRLDSPTHEMVAFFPYLTEPAKLDATAMNGRALTLSYHRDGDARWPHSPQGVIQLRDHARDAFYEVDHPWPSDPPR